MCVVRAGNINSKTEIKTSINAKAGNEKPVENAQKIPVKINDSTKIESKKGKIPSESVKLELTGIKGFEKTEVYIAKVKPGITIEELQKAGAQNNLSEIYVEDKDKKEHYVIYGEKISLENELKPGFKADFGVVKGEFKGAETQDFYQKNVTRAKVKTFEKWENQVVPLVCLVGTAVGFTVAGILASKNLIPKHFGGAMAYGLIALTPGVGGALGASIYGSTIAQNNEIKNLKTGPDPSKINKLTVPLYKFSPDIKNSSDEIANYKFKDIKGIGGNFTIAKVNPGVSLDDLKKAATKNDLQEVLIENNDGLFVIYGKDLFFDEEYRVEENQSGSGKKTAWKETGVSYNAYKELFPEIGSEVDFGDLKGIVIGSGYYDGAAKVRNDFNMDGTVNTLLALPLAIVALGPSYMVFPDDVSEKYAKANDDAFYSQRKLEKKLAKVKPDPVKLEAVTTKVFENK